MPGQYVLISVSDTGTGMDAVTLSRVFEPFFTTKERGKGTGLGLSTVFGIIQQSGGSVWVRSEPMAGTTFTAYLPRVEIAADDFRPTEAVANARGTETILLVEDEDAVRAVARGILARHGYAVLEARGAVDAFAISQRHNGPIHLLLTDIVMPKLSGPSLAAQLAPMRPEMKMLCMSGYTDDAVVRNGFIDGDSAYLEKPFTVASLTTAVRAVLDAPDQPSSPQMPSQYAAFP